MEKEYEYYTITAEKCIKGDTGDEFTGPNNDAVYDRQEFKVRAKSHKQHIWNEDILCGVAKTAQVKLDELKAAGYTMRTDTPHNPVLVGWED